MKVEIDVETMKNANELRMTRHLWGSTWRTVIWFGLGFAALWGSGLDPVDAVRGAAGAAACVAISFALAGLCLGAAGWFATQIVGGAK